MSSDILYSLIIVAPDEPDREYPISQPTTLIGRDSTRADLVLAHAWVSRAHARIYADRDPCRIEDLGSSNGTLINDTPLPPNEPRDLRAGDVISIGPFRLTVRSLARSAEVPEGDRASELAPEQAQADAMAVLGRLATRRASGEGTATPPPPPTVAPDREGARPLEPWVGMPSHGSRWLQYLPPIYGDSDFLGRFLLVFEELLGPIQQTIAHWDLYLVPDTAPESFLPWLNDWISTLVDEHWSADTQRELLRNASWLHQARGTAKGLCAHLGIATGCPVSIDENVEGPHTFRVVIEGGGRSLDQRIIERIIDLNRPAHTSYSISIK